MTLFRITITTALSVSVTLSSASTTLRLASLFQDHMVIQRDTKVPVWGWAQPGAKVSVALQQQSAKARADGDGAWMAWLKPLEAGGPYTLTVIAGDTLVVRDVLCGEVWIGSGQSNMQWPVQESANSAEEVAKANWPAVRMFNAARTVASHPMDTCAGRWAPATSAHVAHFSAVGYYFSRELHKALNVPVGLIHTSWGGTPAESWTTAASLRADPQLAPIFDAVEQARRQSAEAMATYEQDMAQWEEAVQSLRDESGRLPERQIDIGNKGFEQGWAAPDADESEWKPVAVPGFWEKTAGIDIDGAVWFRHTLTVPEAWAGRELRLSLGAIDDFDVTYWNGIKVGATGSETPNFWAAPRNYLLQPAIISAGPASIAIRVFDHWGGGGFAGNAQEMYLVPSGDGPWTPIPLCGTWKYRIERGLTPLIPPSRNMAFQPQNEPGVLYNAMIHPFVPYALRGAIWYQGETNAGRAWQYRTLLPTMIADWRRAWGRRDLAFGIVQLANFMQRNSRPEASEWAELREAQLLSAQADKHSGLVVTIDIGEADDIHPRNKQDVGSRLALWARGAVYGEDIVYSGPTYRGMRVQGDSVMLSFEQVGGGLQTRGETLSGFSVAGPDSQFVWADAVISAQNVIVRSDKVTQPVAVRYGWANNPACNLYNAEGLPASPFRTDNWPGLTDERR